MCRAAWRTARQLQFSARNRVSEVINGSRILCAYTPMYAICTYVNPQPRDFCITDSDRGVAGAGRPRDTIEIPGPVFEGADHSSHRLAEQHLDQPLHQPRLEFEI